MTERSLLLLPSLYKGRVLLALAVMVGGGVASAASASETESKPPEEGASAPREGGASQRQRKGQGQGEGPWFSSRGPISVDRAAVRFVAPETGGVLAPQFVFERVLALEARLLAMIEGAPRVSPRHVRAALERDIAETLLAARATKPAPTEAELAQRTADAQIALIARLGGESAYLAALKAEGISSSEARRLHRRRARASLHLDRMHARLLNPDAAELRVLHRTGQTPFTSSEYESARGPLKRWLVSRRVDTALDDFFRRARGRVSIHWLPRVRTPRSN
jgi:hypothetical protein